MKQTIIKPRSKNYLTILFEVWTFRHFLLYLAIIVMEKRYKETALGWIWLILYPLLPVILFTLVFDRIAQINGNNSSEVPYFLFTLIGMGMWDFFSNSLNWITKSLRLFKKIITLDLCFPPILILIASLATAAVELLTNIALVIVVNVVYLFIDRKSYIVLSYDLFCALWFWFLLVALILGIGGFSSILNAKARDVRYTLSFVLRFWFYLTPIIYPISFIDSNLRWILYLNPMTAIVEGYKWSLLGTGQINLAFLLICTSIVLLIFFSGVSFFLQNYKFIIEHFKTSKVRHVTEDEDL